MTKTKAFNERFDNGEVHVDFPEWSIEALDREAKKIGVI